MMVSERCRPGVNGGLRAAPEPLGVAPPLVPSQPPPPAPAASAGARRRRAAARLLLRPPPGRSPPGRSRLGGSALVALDVEDLTFNVDRGLLVTGSAPPRLPTRETV